MIQNCRTRPATRSPFRHVLITTVLLGLVQWTTAQVDTSKTMTWPDINIGSPLDTSLYQKTVYDILRNNIWLLDRKSIGELNRVAQAKDPLDINNPPVRLVDCGRDKFRLHFRAGSGSIAQPTMKVLKGKLTNLVEGPTVAGGSERGLKVHYGLKSSGGVFEFTFGLQMVELKPTTDTLVWDVIEHGPFYTVSGSGDVDDDTLLGNWQDGKDYWINTEVRRMETGAATSFRHIQKDMDTDGFILQWDRGLAKMIADNAGTEYIRFYCIAEPNIQTIVHGEIDYRHHLCAVALDTAGDDILDRMQQSVGVFTESGVDLGTPCPPRCKKAFFPPYGIPCH